MYVQLASLRIIGNIASGNPNQTQTLIDSGLLTYLKKVINHEKRSVRKETSWIISNIAAGTQRQIEALIVEGYYPILVNIINNDLPEIKREAIWAVCNLTSIERRDLLEKLIKENLLELLSSCLKLKDANQVAVSLEALGNVLEFGKKYYTENGRNLIVTRIYELGMVDVLENLQLHPVQIIYEKTLRFLETYFEKEDEQ